MTNPLRKANDNSRTGGLPSFTTAIVTVAASVAEKTTSPPGGSSTTATSKKPKFWRAWETEPDATNVNNSKLTYQSTIEFLNRPIEEFTEAEYVFYLDPSFKTRFTDVNERAP